MRKDNATSIGNKVPAVEAGIAALVLVHGDEWVGAMLGETEARGERPARIKC